MGAAAERLTKLIDDPGRYNIPAADLRQAQIEAMNERFQERKGAIKLLGHRAQEAGLTAVRDLHDIVPLLFAHTTYKSYPESFLIEERWDRLCKWLDTVSSYRVNGVDLNDVQDIDDWIERLEAAGHYVSCSSGTTGKSAMLVGSQADMAWAGRATVSVCAWGAAVPAAHNRKMFGLSPVASVPRNKAIATAMTGAFSDPGGARFEYPVPPMTIGRITGMIALRKSIADGTAKPAQIAAYEATSAERQETLDKAVGITAKALVEARTDKLFLTGMWATLYQVAETVRGMGYSAKDFHPENAIYIGGGLKRAQLPPNYREYVYDTFNIAPERVIQIYGMQELGTTMPRCKAGRYHVAPWLICLLLDEGGDNLLPMTGGEIEGRAAFFDLSIDGRWGGVISGDKISVDYGKCACGSEGPTVRDNITRYADAAGGDKITCAGTIDAYVRGVA